MYQGEETCHNAEVFGLEEEKYQGIQDGNVNLSQNRNEEDMEGSRVSFNTMVKTGTKISDTEVKIDILRNDDTTGNISIISESENVHQRQG